MHTDPVWPTALMLPTLHTLRENAVGALTFISLRIIHTKQKQKNSI